MVSYLLHLAFFIIIIYCLKYLFCHLFRFFVLMLWSHKKLIKLIKFNSIKFYLKTTKSQQQLLHSALCCKVKTLQ